MKIAANGEVYTWGWKECVPTGKVVSVGGLEKDQLERHSSMLTEQGVLVVGVLYFRQQSLVFIFTE